MRTSTYWKEKIVWILNNKAKYALYGEKVYFSSVVKYVSKYTIAKRSEKIYETARNIKRRKNIMKRKERKSNCLNCHQCNKEVKKLRAYYRNGYWFCNYKCYKKYAKEKRTKDDK